MHSPDYQPLILALGDSPEILALYEELLLGEHYRVTTGTHATFNMDRIAKIRRDLIISDSNPEPDENGLTVLEAYR